jgi:hypothetical protein
MSKPKRSQDPIMNGSICPYCGGTTIYTDSKVIYGKSYGMIYLCRSCKAYVGVHRGTNISLGRLANAELRELKKQTHSFFDKIWKYKLMSRHEAYQWLCDSMKIPKDETHVGMFSEERCKEAIRLCKQLLNDNRRLDLDFGVEPVTPFYDPE